jgi:hypothetical protein
LSCGRSFSFERGRRIGDFSDQRVEKYSANEIALESSYFGRIGARVYLEVVEDPLSRCGVLSIEDVIECVV